MAFRAGRYEILRPIASGGMGSVHLGRLIGPGGFERQVAIKAIHPHLAEQPDSVAMFLDEARLSARVHHPNVVATLDVQQDDAGMFLVMEYVAGLPLQAILVASRDGSRPLPFGITLRIILDALAGLHAAHELTDASGVPLKVIHRDVSPHNILVSVEGVARITDFGIARAAVRLASTRQGQLKGKLRYLAPEQVGGSEVDRRADVYAAGAVLWEMLAGRCLVRGQNEGACLLEISRPDKESPRALNPHVPEPIAESCLRALRLDPKERHATAAAFAGALEVAAASAGLVVASPREVSDLVRALQDRGAGIRGSPSDRGGGTVTDAPLGPSRVATQHAGAEVPRAEPTSRPTTLAVAAAVLAAGAAVLAIVALTRSPASVQPAAGAAMGSAMPVAAGTVAPVTSGVDDAPPASPPSVAPPRPSASPSAAAPGKQRAIPAKPSSRFRPREL